MKNTHFIFAVFTLYIAQPAAIAQYGLLDYSFTGDGKVETPVGGNGRANAIAIQPDGKILLAGWGGDNFVITRYLTDGTPDASFDGDGMVVTDFGGIDKILDVIIQPDGKILAAGQNLNPGSGMFALARYNADGSLDNTFNGSGKVTTAFAPAAYSSAGCLALQPDGKIIVGGTIDPVQGVARYHANGSLDTTFNGTGWSAPMIMVDIGGYSSVIPQSDGSIIACGHSSFSIYNSGMVDRYNADGTYNGIVLNTGFQSAIHDVMMLPDSGYLVATSHYASDVYPTIRRYNNDWTAHAGFGSGGVATFPADGLTNIFSSLSIQADGKIIATGYIFSPDRNFMLARLHPNGNLDSTFGINGITITDFGQEEWAWASAVQADGKILLAGSIGPDDDGDFLLARYHTNTVGMAEWDKLSGLQVYPNPASDIVTIQSETGFTNATLTLTDLSGKTIYTQRHVSGNRVELDLSNYVTGIYLLHVSQGAAVSHTKLVKQ